MTTRALRCAIYTRKSSEEGLDQTFNSLDAQREACAAYIQSQRHEGWRLLPARYDDGGYSGGTLERPALQQLLAEIAAGSVDLIVVYKVDRLTRSLNDFAKLVDQLDAKDVSFVSVTQSFNTTTSMGRLTLNVLLSFAQFEREVTGERIRDKIAASKRKGMWMGGMVPLGYDCVDRKLVVNPAEAEQVRHMFTRYLDLGSFSQLREELKGQGIRSKVRTNAAENRYGGCSLTSGAVFTILTNPVYRGQIRHRDQVHPGQQDAIVSEELWIAVQALRERTRQANSTLPRAQEKSPLLGLLTDQHGRSYQPVHTTKRHRRYRYYVSKAKSSGAAEASVRLPAVELETHVSGRLRAFFGNDHELLDVVAESCDSTQVKKQLLAVARRLAATEATGEWATWRPLLEKVVIEDKALTLRLNRIAVREALGLQGDGEESDSDKPIDLRLPLGLHRTAHELRLVIPSEGSADEAAKRNPSLIRFIGRGRRWYRQLTSGEMPSIKAIAKAENVTERYVARVLKGSLLAPDLVQRILEGRQPVTLTVRKLLDPLPMDWAEQRHFFGLSPN